MSDVNEFQRSDAATGNERRPTVVSRNAIGPLSCLSCLSVTLVYCGQTVGWIKCRLVAVYLGSGHIVLNGNAAPRRKGHSSPHFSAHVYYGSVAAELLF